MAWPDAVSVIAAASTEALQKNLLRVIFVLPWRPLERAEPGTAELCRVNEMFQLNRASKRRTFDVDAALQHFAA
jgi:hypothetical protein